MSNLPKKPPFDFKSIGSIKSVDDAKKWLEQYARDFEKWYRLLAQRDAYEDYLYLPGRSGGQLVKGDTDFGDDDNRAQISSVGDITFKNGGGLAVGCLDGIDQTVTCTVQNTYYQVTFDVAGPSNLVESDIANNELDVTDAGAGIYIVAITACLHSANAQDFELLVRKNDGTADLNPHLFQTTGVGAKVENVAGICGIDVTGATDRIELWVRCTSAAAKDIIFDHVSLVILQVAGT